MLIAANLCKTYKVPVVTDAGLECEPGTVIGIAGKNGSGKSTLLSMLTGLVKPDSGKVTVDGTEILGNRRLIRDQIGFAPQNLALFEDLSVADNFRFWCSAYKRSFKKTQDFIFEYDKSMLGKRVRNLSGGMRKKLNIDLSLINDPKYVVLDEPTSELDIASREQVLNAVGKLRERGKCVIFTSHHTDELKMCDTILIMNGGRFVYSGNPKEITEIAAKEIAGGFNGFIKNLIFKEELL